MIFNVNSTRGQTRFLTCVARVTCLVIIKRAGFTFNKIAIQLSKEHLRLQYKEVITAYRESTPSSYDFSDALHMRSIMHCFLAGCARLPQPFQWLLLQNLEVMIKIGIKSSTHDSS